MKPALLVIDVQKQFFKISPVTAQSLEEAIEYINAAIDMFRDHDLPVICIQHMDKACSEMLAYLYCRNRGGLAGAVCKGDRTIGVQDSEPRFCCVADHQRQHALHDSISYGGY